MQLKFHRGAGVGKRLIQFKIESLNSIVAGSARVSLASGKSSHCAGALPGRSHLGLLMVDSHTKGREAGE